MLGPDTRMAQFKVAIEFFNHETMMKVLSAAMAGMVVLEAGPGSERRNRGVDYIRYVVWHPNLPPSHIVHALNGKPPMLQMIELQIETLDASGARYKLAWVLRAAGRAGVLWGFTVDLSQVYEKLPAPGDEANTNKVRGNPVVSEVDPRNPEHISDVFQRIGRHLKVMENYIDAGKKHTWMNMSRDVLDAICLQHKQLGDLIAITRQMSRQGANSTHGAQDGLGAVNARLDVIEKRIDGLSKRMSAVMAKQEDIDAKLEEPVT